jgi:hypothetical protein
MHEEEGLLRKNVMMASRKKLLQSSIILIFRTYSYIKSIVKGYSRLHTFK